MESNAEFRFNKRRAIGIINGLFIKPLLKKGYRYNIRQNNGTIEVSFDSNGESVNGLKFDYFTGQLTLSLKENLAKKKLQELPKNIKLKKSLNNGVTLLDIDCKKQPTSAFIKSVKHIVDHF